MKSLIKMRFLKSLLNSIQRGVIWYIIQYWQKPTQEVDLYWQAIDSFKRRIKSNLRHLVESLNFSSAN